MSLLKVDGLSVNFGGLKAVDNVSFQLEARQIFSIVGPNGAGKTTMFNLITGYLRPMAGRVEFCDENITSLPPHELSRKGLVRSFQQNELFGDCTVMENLMIGNHFNANGANAAKAVFGSIFFLPAQAKAEELAREHAEEIVEYIGLKDKRNVKARSLAHGDQRLLGMGVALATRPKLLMLDEPIGGMTVEESEKVISFLYHVKESSAITILLIEHNMGVVMRISDKVMVLESGVKIAEGFPEEIQNNQRVIDAYLGKW